MTDSAPTISVLLPVYNAEKYIRDAVESVLAQTFGDFELLVIDDGSADRSLSILRRFESADSRVRIISRENRGLVSTLNELIGQSRGRYLARMDADDICHATRFAKQVAYLDANDECVAVGSRSLFMDPQGMPICEHLNELTHGEIDAAHISGKVGSRICHPSAMMRQDAVLRVGLYRQEYLYAEDLDLFLRLAEIGKLANLPDVLIRYRFHLESVCHTYRDDQRVVARRAVQSARRRRGMTEIPELIEPARQPETIPEAHRKWAWWALGAGNVWTARKYAIKACLQQPFNIENLRVLACAVRGH